MKMGNDRLYLAIQALLFGEGDIRSRVVTACLILHRMGRSEVTMGLRIRIDEVLQKASPKPAFRDADGNVLAGYSSSTLTASFFGGYSLKIPEESTCWRIIAYDFCSGTFAMKSSFTLFLSLLYFEPCSSRSPKLLDGATPNSLSHIATKRASRAKELFARLAV